MSLFLGLCLFFALLVITGWIATLALFDFRLAAFKKSALYVKVLMWIPIAIIFILLFFAPKTVQLLSLYLLTTMMILEWIRLKNKNKFNHLSLFFIFFLVVGMLHVASIKASVNGDQLLLSLAVGTVLSDVFAFFLGKTVGKHMLPASINSRKSWEGVGGQFVGALIGITLIKLLFFPHISTLIAIPVGLGSFIGDIFNSSTKRLFGVRGWGSAIPGHGGLIDRLSSFSGSALFLYYYLLL